MSPTINGPITLGNTKEIPSIIVDTAGEIKLPFSSTSFTFNNNKLEGKKFKMSDGEIITAKKGKLETAKIETEII